MEIEGEKEIIKRKSYISDLVIQKSVANIGFTYKEIQTSQFLFDTPIKKIQSNFIGHPFFFQNSFFLNRDRSNSHQLKTPQKKNLEKLSNKKKIIKSEKVLIYLIENQITPEIIE